MSYLLENDTEHIINDIIKRKEFYQFDLPKIHNNDDRLNNNIIPLFMLEKMISDGNYLQFHSYQLFVSNYMNPNTPYSRLLMKWQTGTGKSIGALSIALNFINYLQKEEAQGSLNTGSVFIMGFTSHIFKNELLRFPEFGIINRQELAKLNILRKLAYGGNKFDVENLQEFLMKIKKKFNNRKNNGFFQFIGYKKLVNMIFEIRDPKINLVNLTEHEIDLAIQSDKIKVNTSVLDGFKNSLIICDEIHNVYNSLYKNNWGIALQYVLNYHSSIRAVFMSATPINNSPTEIVDLLNLLLPKSQYKPLEKSDFFDIEKKLKPGALNTLATLCKGRISYLSDADPKYYPTKQFIGDSIPNTPYLKFVRCPMSEFHYNTYKEVYTGSLSPESQYLTDFAIPNPNNPNIGLYQTSEIKKLLPYASQKWKDDNKINFKKNKIVGDILRLQNLSKITTKYTKMMEVINEIIQKQRGKIFIFHNVIHMSGVLFIQEILLQNYIIGEYDSSTANTLCVICGKMRKDHSTQQLGGGNKVKSDFIQAIQDSDKSLAVRYNYSTDYYEVGAQYDPNIIEYKLLQTLGQTKDIVIISNMDDTAPLFTQIISAILLSNPIIIKAKSNNIELGKIMSNLQFYILSAEGINEYIYYASSNLCINANDNHKLIKHVKLATTNRKIGGSKKRQPAISKKHGENPDAIDPNHTYMPVRFIAVHSELDRNSMNDSLSKYNSPDNSDGYRIMILIGGRLIKEAYDIKAVRELMIMGRPDNIPTLIQILGRAVRKGSHKYLPQHKRNVNIRIFTSCLPTKINMGGKTIYGLGYEETKYIEKLQHYIVIQSIEKTLHENAIDAYINQDIIWSPEERHLHKTNKHDAELGPLYFEPNVDGKLKTSMNQKNKYTFKLSELNLQTFNAFHAQTEIDNIFTIIKRLFIEKSPVWTYQDLFEMVKNSRKYFQVEFNTLLISEELFIVALSRLVWAKDINYVEPVITTIVQQQQFLQNNIIDKLFDIDDKVIILPNNQKSVITQMGLYYILFPLDELNNEPIQIIELPYRLIQSKESVSIDIKSFLESGNPLINYTDKRDRFFNNWNNVNIENLELAVCDFGTDFHILFLEECIKYIFNVWTDPKIKKSFMHAFYFKMLNYYDLRNLVVWGHTTKPYIFKKYISYINPITVKIQQKKNTNIKGKLEDIQENEVSTSGIINMLKSSINKSDLHWVSSGLKKQFEENLEKSLSLFDGNYKKTVSNKKINADLVPVGHFLNYIPKFYHPIDGWFESPEYLDSQEQFVENEIIVGYDERSKTGVHIRFKIRTPIHNIKQYRDSRMIEKGSVCMSKGKSYLKDIAEKIGIKYKDTKKINVVSLCNEIRTKLIYLELKERIAKTNKKWFYFIYEKRPETIIEEKKNSLMENP